MMDGRESILVVDDENTVQLLLKTELEDAGFDVEIAGDIAEALQLVERRVFGAALIDKNLPDGDGLGLVRKLRESYPEMELIIMTGYASLESAIQAVRIGVFDYITKPFDHLGGVVQRVCRALEKRRQARELRRLVSHLADANRQLSFSMAALKRAYGDTARAVADILDMLGPEGGREADRITSLATRVGRAMQLDNETVEWLGLAALMRDVGEVADEPALGSVPPVTGIPQPPSPVAESLMQKVADLEPVARIVRHHQEHYDGSGYPDGLARHDIPLGARVLAVVNAFVSLTTERPYRAAMDPQQALGVVRGCAGSEFDPQVVEAFQRVVVGEAQGGAGEVV